VRSSLRLHDPLKRRDRGGVTFDLYMAALDAEERAAGVYARLVRRADKLPWSEDPPVESLGGPMWGLDWP
jgi:hypothetical protein